ncbi:hypothetical protein DFP78_11674 [Photobacterium lutimaris]|nr:hypothetical protein DFP78_11674 [Photobacterium lutimaris]
MPVILYACNFGVGIWRTQEEWAKMGSALGGIYAPILSLLTLIVIVRQLNLQWQMNKFQHDQWYIDKCMSQGHKALVNLKCILSAEIKGQDGVTCQELFEKIHERGKKHEIDVFLQCNLQLQSATTFFFSNLEGLRSSNEPIYKTSYMDLVTEGSSVLGYVQMQMLEEQIMFKVNGRPLSHYPKASK